MSVLDEYIETHVQTFDGEWDEEGVYFYQAFNDGIADYALENQKFGGPYFNDTRMTWIKPSFGWMLYRSGYGLKHGQNRVLKIKLSHETVAFILSNCTCPEAGWHGKRTEPCPDGRIQWDPARDIYHSEKKKPRKMINKRAIQIGLARSLSEFYNDNIISIEEVTNLANRVGVAHCKRKRNETDRLMADLTPELSLERHYLPHANEQVLSRLGMMVGPGSKRLAKLGKGKNL